MLRGWSYMWRSTNRMEVWARVDRHANARKFGVRLMLARRLFDINGAVFPLIMELF
jgi:hypothetical protein